MPDWTVNQEKKMLPDQDLPFYSFLTRDFGISLFIIYEINFTLFSNFWSLAFLRKELNSAKWHPSLLQAKMHATSAELSSIPEEGQRLKI